MPSPSPFDSSTWFRDLHARYPKLSGEVGPALDPRRPLASYGWSSLRAFLDFRVEAGLDRTVTIEAHQEAAAGLFRRRRSLAVELGGLSPLHQALFHRLVQLHRWRIVSRNPNDPKDIDWREWRSSDPFCELAAEERDQSWMRSANVYQPLEMLAQRMRLAPAGSEERKTIRDELYRKLQDAGFKDRQGGPTFQFDDQETLKAVYKEYVDLREELVQRREELLEAPKSLQDLLALEPGNAQQLWPLRLLYPWPLEELAILLSEKYDPQQAAAYIMSYRLGDVVEPATIAQVLTRRGGFAATLLPASENPIREFTR